MSRKCSGYLSIYNDWDLLEPALRSVAPMIDELVVVDGAYDWMAEYSRRLGHDPLRSDQRVYDIIAALGIPYRTVSRLWSNEIEKRLAGYAACAHRYVCRIDADEVLTLDTAELERFFAANGAVAEMDMPTYIAPGWIQGTTGTDHAARQAFLFDREQVSADLHLNYLWLVLTADKLPRPGERPWPVHGQPVAFNAHLTEWRTPETALMRASFYTMNYMRAHGVPWLPELRNVPLQDPLKLFERVTPAQFKDILLGSRLVAGNADLPAGGCVRRSPLSEAQEAAFAGCYGRLMDELGALNRDLVNGRYFVTGQRVSIDIGTPGALEALTPDEMIVFEFTGDVAAAKVELRCLTADEPWQATREPRHWRSGRFLCVHVSPAEWARRAFLRRKLEFQVWMAPGHPVQQFRVRADRPLPGLPAVD